MHGEQRRSDRHQDDDCHVARQDQLPSVAQRARNPHGALNTIGQLDLANAGMAIFGSFSRSGRDNLP